MGPKDLPQARRASGQAIVETIMLLPLVLLLMFALIQIGHIGVATAIVHYAASSAARQAVMDNDEKSTNAENRFRSLLAAGVTLEKYTTDTDHDPVAPNITVIGCGALPAYPFVGQFLNKALHSTSDNDCDPGAKSFGPVALKGPAPFQFIIEGKAMARMNYNPK